MKRFNLKQAKLGGEVVTKEGKAAKILLFDRSSKDFPLVVIIENKNVFFYTEKGRFYKDKPSINDLRMKE